MYYLKRNHHHHHDSLERPALRHFLLQELTENDIERPERSSAFLAAEKLTNDNNTPEGFVVVSTDVSGDIEEGQSFSVEDEKEIEENHGVFEAMEKDTEPKIPNEEEIMDTEKGVMPSETVDEKDQESNDANNIQTNGTGDTELATTTEHAVDDGMSDTGSSDGEMMEVISFNGDDDGMVSIPVAGEGRHDMLPENVTGTQRKEPNGCAICLCPFEVADKVTWSSNPSCQHVFHEECIKDWLIASGRKFLKRQRREQRRTGNLSYDSDPISKITGFPMLCPCCRQTFIMPEEEEESVDEKNAAAAPEGNNAEMGGTEAAMVATS